MKDALEQRQQQLIFACAKLKLLGPPEFQPNIDVDIVVLVVLWAMEKMGGAPLKTGGRHENVGNRWKA